YMHLVDHARAHIEETYPRPWPDRLIRAVLAAVLPYPARFRAALAAAWLPGRIAALFPAALRPRRKAIPVGEGVGAFFARLAATLALTPARLTGGSAARGPAVFTPETPRRGR